MVYKDITNVIRKIIIYLVNYFISREMMFFHTKLDNHVHTPDTKIKRNNLKIKVIITTVLVKVETTRILIYIKVDSKKWKEEKIIDVINLTDNLHQIADNVVNLIENTLTVYGN